MSATRTTETDDFAWETQPDAALWVRHTAESLAGRNPTIDRLNYILLNETGTRLLDSVDHIAIDTRDDSDTDRLKREMAGVGYAPEGEVWRHPRGMFPPVRFDAATATLAIRVESVDAAAERLANALDLPAVAANEISGQRGGPRRTARLHAAGGVEILLVERHGWRGFSLPATIDDASIEAAARHLDTFRGRERTFSTDDLGFVHASHLISSASVDLGLHWACDLFFTAEREYWQSRNRAARVQFERQNRLGLGWGNHDHHTYRSSRRSFRHLIATLEQLGFVCRERFYAGREAGWGAQVLEQPECRIVIFADVDLSPEEVAGDFAHEPLLDRAELGTVGLWCELHGEAFLEAGMHHLECQFDFDAARAQLAEAGVESMAPFTDFAFLKQAFTRGEIWPVDPRRTARLLADGRITADEADRFNRAGAVGSHLEILERNDGYKGFNQTGISEIIARTDPRGAIGA